MGAGIAVASLSGCPDQSVPRESRVVVARLGDLRDRGNPPDPASLVVRDIRTFPVQDSEASKRPTATLLDETRTLLAGHERSLLKVLDPVRIEDGGRLQMEVDLWFELPGATSVVLAPTLFVDGGRAALGPRKLPVVRRGRRRLATLETVVSGTRPREGRITIEGLRPPGQARTQVWSLPVMVPAGARLEFGFGVLEPAWTMGPVGFQVERCIDDACAPIFREVLDPAGTGRTGWQDRRVELPASESPAKFRFVTQRNEAAAFSLPVWSDPVITAPAQGPRPPNFILVSLDTLRRDHLDVYGYARETAPFLRELVEERGVVFEDVTAEAATTDPSHMTLFTSLPALVHGVQRRQEALQVPVTTLAEALRDDGYRTAAFTENGPLARERGFGIGFETYAENKSIDLVHPTGHVERTLSQGREWLERHGEVPFFLFLHTFQVHAPYAPPERLESLFADESPPPPGLDAKIRERRRTLVNDYDREIRFVDEQLEALYRWAETRGLMDDTWWIFLSDHGEEFFEHGELGHSTLPYEEVLRVPLLIVGPTARPGARDATPLHHVDLMPTLLELAGIALGDGTWGESFAARLEREAPTDRSRVRFSATWMLPAGFQAPAHSAQRGATKLIRVRKGGPWRDRVLDLESGETRAPEQDERRIFAELSAHLDSHLARAKEARAARGPTDRAPGEPVPLDPEREAKLRALGYID